MFELGAIFPLLRLEYKLNAYELALAPVYAFILFRIANKYRQRLRKDPILYKYYGMGFNLKMFSSVFFCLIYMYYYNGGDTAGFYHWCNQWFYFLFREPTHAIAYILFNDEESFWRFFTTSDLRSGYTYLMRYGTNENTFNRIASVVNLIGLNSFVATTMIFGYLSFLGGWRLFIVFYDQYPHLRKQIAMACLFIPSVVFWGSGLMKDTLTLMGVCWLTYSLYFGFVKRQDVTRNLIWGFIMAVMVAKLKGYIILAFIPAAAYWAVNKYRENIKSGFLRVATGPFFMIAAGILMLGLMRLVGDSLGKFSIDKLEQTASGYQSWHTETGGSSYTIYGAGDFSPLGLLKTFPQGINVTLFRPYLFEARSIFNLMAAIEGAIMLYLTLSILWRTKVVRLPEALAKDTNIAFCLTFALILAFAVGITSFNFGALVRYKIPVMPYYAIALILIDDVIRKSPLLGGRKR